ncbi:MAG: hypothetical protein DWQ01_08620 [Planctomycetota bacterium]|nr:MAG: hypothetical protein DWQ01_08620 [Planctomycetota bacterium]
MALLTLSEVKTYLGVGGTNEDDFLNAVIPQAEAAAARFCRRDSFESGNFTELFDGRGMNEVWLRNTPILSVSSVHDDIENNFDSNTELAASDFAFSADGQLWLKPSAELGSRFLRRGWFANGTNNVRVVYDGGYTAQTVPHDLRLALMELIGFVRGKAGTEAFSSINVGSYARVMRPAFADAWPKDITLLLAPFQHPA